MEVDPWPVARFNHGAVYDPARSRILIYGGTTALDAFSPYYPIRDLWQLSLLASPAWERLMLAPPDHDGPSSDAGTALVLDPPKDRLLLFGGMEASLRNDLWTLELGGRGRPGAGPLAFQILRLSPNPATGPLQIEFALPTWGNAEVTIFDVTGRKIRSLALRPGGPGAQVTWWDGKDSRGAPARTGIYFVSLRSGTTQHTRKFVLVH